LYLVNRELYKDIDAAKILGTSEDSLSKIMVDRGERKAFNFLNEGIFRPLTISRDTQELFAINAERLGIANPYEQAADVIGRIQEVLSAVPLDADLFPNIDNPFKINVIPDLVGQVSETVTQTAPIGAPVATAGFFGQGNVNIDAVTGLTREQDLIYNNPTDRAIARKQNQQKRVIT